MAFSNISSVTFKPTNLNRRTTDILTCLVTTGKSECAKCRGTAIVIPHMSRSELQDVTFDSSKTLFNINELWELAPDLFLHWSKTLRDERLKAGIHFCIWLGFRVLGRDVVLIKSPPNGSSNSLRFSFEGWADSTEMAWLMTIKTLATRQQPLRGFFFKRRHWWLVFALRYCICEVRRWCREDAQKMS